MSEDSIARKAVASVGRSSLALSRFITANDTGATGGHQSGFHLPIGAYKLYFEEEGVKGSNMEKFVKIKWQDDFITDSRFIYYGIGTRNEYRLTRFGRGFPFLQDENIGDLLVLCKLSDEDYEAYVLSADEDIEEFLSAFNLSTEDTNKLIPVQNEVVSEDDLLLEKIEGFLTQLSGDFPSTSYISEEARRMILEVRKHTAADVRANPDKELLDWIETEYQLFKAIENDLYYDYISKPFETVENLVSAANTILNRRKSRAGKSLEHHLSEVFKISELRFSEQAVTEQNKKPDFIFPGEIEYHDSSFDKKKLVFLGAKTTCKDRWRQILNEASRIPVKHLFTLQQGISSNQLQEMEKHDVKLVIPKKYKKFFPAEHRDKILILNDFVGYVQSTQ